MNYWQLLYTFSLAETKVEISSSVFLFFLIFWIGLIFSTPKTYKVVPQPGNARNWTTLLQIFFPKKIIYLWYIHFTNSQKISSKIDLHIILNFTKVFSKELAYMKLQNRLITAQNFPGCKDVAQRSSISEQKHPSIKIFAGY